MFLTQVKTSVGKWKYFNLPPAETSFNKSVCVSWNQKKWESETTFLLCWQIFFNLFHDNKNLQIHIQTKWRDNQEVNYRHSIFCSPWDCWKSNRLYHWMKSMLGQTHTHTHTHTQWGVEVVRVVPGLFFQGGQISLKHWTRSNCCNNGGIVLLRGSVVYFISQPTIFPHPVSHSTSSDPLWSHCEPDCKYESFKSKFCTQNTRENVWTNSCTDLLYLLCLN